MTRPRRLSTLSHLKIQQATQILQQVNRQGRLILQGADLDSSKVAPTRDAFGPLLNRAMRAVGNVSGSDLRMVDFGVRRAFEMEERNLRELRKQALQSSPKPIASLADLLKQKSEQTEVSWQTEGLMSLRKDPIYHQPMAVQYGAAEVGIMAVLATLYLLVDRWREGD